MGLTDWEIQQSDKRVSVGAIPQPSSFWTVERRSHGVIWI